MTGRAQTETVGVIATTAVLLVVATTVGLVLVDATTSGADASGPLGEYRFEANGTGVTVTHAGGDAVPLGELTLHVDAEGESTTASFEDGALVRGRGAFTPGSAWRFEGGPFPYDRRPELRLLVVHDPTETVVADARVGAGSGATGTPTPTSTPTATPTSTPTTTPTATPTPSATPTPPPEPPDDGDGWDDVLDDIWDSIEDWFDDWFDDWFGSGHEDDEGAGGGGGGGGPGDAGPGDGGPDGGNGDDGSGPDDGDDDDDGPAGWWPPW